MPGTDYCIGFSTCVTRTIEMTNRLRTSAGSHERFLVIEVFGRYAGFTARSSKTISPPSNIAPSETSATA